MNVFNGILNDKYYGAQFLGAILQPGKVIGL